MTHNERGPRADTRGPRKKAGADHFLNATHSQRVPPGDPDCKRVATEPLWVDPLSADYDGLPGDPGTPPARLALVDLLEEARSTPMRAGDRATVLDLIGRIEHRACPRAERDLRVLLGCA